MAGEHTGEIYMLRFPNGKAYIGQTVRSAMRRFSEHCKSDMLVGKALKKYGRQSVRMSVLATAAESELDDIEIAMIKEHGTVAPNGYNIVKGGDVFRDKHAMTAARVNSERFQQARKEVADRESSNMARRATRMAQRKARSTEDEVGREYKAWRDAYKWAAGAVAALPPGSTRDPFKEVAEVYGEGVPHMPDDIVRSRRKAKYSKIGQAQRDVSAQKRWEKVKGMCKAKQQEVIYAARRNAIYIARTRTPDRMEQVVRAWEEEWALFESHWASLPGPPASCLQAGTGQVRLP